MVEFLNKFQGHDIKIDRVISIRVAKPFIFFNSLRVVTRDVTSSWAIVLYAVSFACTSFLLYTLGATKSQLDLPSLALLYVDGWDRLQLGAVH